MKENLTDCEGTVVDSDDILVHGSDKKEHDERLHKVLRSAFIHFIYSHKNHIYMAAHPKWSALRLF